jgi:murein DD-endopeptidase MepM/ murein hydrolase activator NlpD
MRILVLLSSLLASPLYALPEQALVPGGIALLGLPNYQKETVVRFDGKRVAVFPYKDKWYAMAGISLNAKPGEHKFSIEHHTGITLSTRIQVKDKKYAVQHLTIKDKRKVEPSESDLIRIAGERKRKQKAKNLRTETIPNVDFIWPVTGEISSIFGLRRYFNEQVRNPHNGLDIAAAEGTPIKATASGTVIDAGDFFFSGNMIYLDHGQGIISLYAHLSRIDVKPGDVLQKGDIIGAVGQTGRVTGPHLHFAVFANRTLVDPVYMLPRKQPEQAIDASSQSGRVDTAHQ